MTLTRKPLYAPRGAVATSQPLAASAGLNALRKGGNAVDAVLAAAITLTVVQPGSNDIGGDLFAIVWDGSTLHGLNASGRAPAGLTRELAAAHAIKDAGALGGAQGAEAELMPNRGWLPVTVPGAPAGWRDLHARFGVLPFEELFLDAVGYAAGGYPVSTQVARGWAVAVRAHAALTGPEYAEWGRVYTVDGGRAPRAGELFANPDAARTLRLIADSGAEDFYRGQIADALVTAARETGGRLTAEDLSGHTSTWVDPIKINYRGYDVWELPPNGQGLAALIALGLLDGFPVGDDPDLWRHRQIEAIKLAFADAHAYIADPSVVPVPVEQLLDPGYLAGRRALIGDCAGDPAPGEPARGGTVYLCAADQDGVMVSLIQSNYEGFGSYVMAPGTGFGLQNRGAGFSLRADHPNVVAGGKRPYHTIIPGFLTKDGAAVGPFGVMGGHMQPQGHVQLISSTVDGGLDPQAALDAPRWYWHRGRQLYTEPELSTVDLQRRGHEVTVNESGVYGYGQAIWRLPDGGYVAGSEPRADGCAVGY